MKSLVKRVARGPVLQHARILRDRLLLATTPSMNFDEAPLGQDLTPGRLSEILCDPEHEAAWDQASHEISAAFGRGGIPGGVNPGDRRALYYLVRALRPANLLEIGTHVGASTIFLAHALGESSARANITTVDILDVNAPDGPWLRQGLAQPPILCLEKLGLSQRVKFKSLPSKEFLKAAADKFDFIFLDGDHSSATVYEEISLALGTLAPGGVILLHDYYPGGRPLFPDGTIIPGPFMAAQRIARENPSITVLPLGQLPWETKQGCRSTSLAIVTRNP